jgi:hypothetical protein
VTPQESRPQKEPPRSHIGPWVVLALLLGLLTCDVQDGQAQSWDSVQQAAGEHTELTSFASLALWPEAKRSYQHVYEAGGRGHLEAGPAELSGYVRGVFWQTSASKVPGSPVNAENNMGNTVKYGGSLKLYVYGGWHVGPAVHRTEMHVVWRFKGDHGYRDGYGSYEGTPGWERREELCRAGRGCPSIAYQDGIGAILGYDGTHVRARVKYLRPWKDQLTLRPRPVRALLLLEAPKRWGIGKWEAEARAQLGAKGQAFGDIRLRHSLLGPLWLTLRYGRLQPDHKTPFYRPAVGLLVR